MSKKKNFVVTQVMVSLIDDAVFGRGWNETQDREKRKREAEKHYEGVREKH